MRQTLISLVMIGFNFFAVAQQSYQNQIELIKEAETHATRHTATWENSKQIIVNDSSSYTLKEVVEARTIDSLWGSFMADSTRYREMYNSISKEEFKVVEYEELSTELLKERLQILNEKTPFYIEYNPKLENVIKQYLKYRKKSLQHILGLSQYYFPLFEEILDKHNLPLELKYLAIVESALDPRAKSPAGASGLWQFMYRTGKAFGLENNSYVDERNEPVLATEAASKYLTYLYDIMEDWDLALAAYNSGPGNVSKAIRRSGGSKNYWNIRPYLPTETANYLPAFLATMYIFEFAEEHGLYSNTPQMSVFTTDTIHIKEKVSLKQIAQVTDLPLEKLQFLNPSYKLDVLPKNIEQPSILRLPIEAVGIFVANEEHIYAYAKEQFDEVEKPLPELYNQPDPLRYQVKSGDFLGKIAKKYSVSVLQIKQWNNLKNNNLNIGQTLLIYPNSSIAENSNRHKANLIKEYIVQPGDSLWSISKKFPGVSIENIRKWNGISGNNLKPGKRLKINQS